MTPLARFPLRSRPFTGTTVRVEGLAHGVAPVHGDFQVQAVVAQEHGRKLGFAPVPGELGRIHARIHAGQDREMARRRRGKLRFGAEIGGITGIGGEDFVAQAHAFFPSSVVPVYQLNRNCEYP